MAAEICMKLSYSQKHVLISSSYLNPSLLLFKLTQGNKQRKGKQEATCNSQRRLQNQYENSFFNTSNTHTRTYFHSISSDLNDQIWGLKMPVRLTTENLGVWNNWLKLFSSSNTATVQWITKRIRDSVNKRCKDFIWLFPPFKNLQ